MRQVFTELYLVLLLNVLLIYYHIPTLSINNSNPHLLCQSSSYASVMWTSLFLLFFFCISFSEDIFFVSLCVESLLYPCSILARASSNTSSEVATDNLMCPAALGPKNFEILVPKLLIHSRSCQVERHRVSLHDTSLKPRI